MVVPGSTDISEEIHDIPGNPNDAFRQDRIKVFSVYICRFLKKIGFFTGFLAVPDCPVQCKIP